MLNSAVGVVLLNASCSREYEATLRPSLRAVWFGTEQKHMKPQSFLHGVSISTTIVSRGGRVSRHLFTVPSLCISNSWAESLPEPRSEALFPVLIFLLHLSEESGHDAVRISVE